MRFHNITKDDMLNGDGLRTVLWVSGCSHFCNGCHNPITWDENSGVEFNIDSEKELFNEIEKDYISGVTFSGGDPLYNNNRECILEIAKKIEHRFKDNKTIWLYTGFLWEEICDLEIVNYIDVLVDGKFVEALKNTQLKWRGSSNQRVIDVKRTLKEKRIILWTE